LTDIVKSKTISRLLSHSIEFGLTAFSLSMAMLIVLVGLAWKIEHEAMAHAERVSHTYLVLNRLSQIRAEALQIEYSTQNFRVTGDQSHLEERNLALKKREGLLADIQQLTLDNASQATRWTQLRKVIDERIEISKQVEATRKTEGGEAANRLAAQLPLRETRERMSALLNEMSAEEMRLLGVRMRDQETSQQRAKLAQIFAAVAMFVMIVVGVLLLRNNHRRILAAQHEAERATRAKSQFLANMSHEIRTPLAAVVGLSHLLDRAELSPDARSLVARIRWSSAQLTHLVSDVLDVSKIEAGALNLETMRFNLISLLDDAVTSIASQAAVKNVATRINIEPNVPKYVLGDPTRIGQIVGNLLSNAVKFTERGAVVVNAAMVSRQDDIATVQIVVSDTGIGIAPEVQQKLFDPFTQAESSTTRRFGGTGLGLSIVRELVHLMNGSIELSSNVGAGSRFTVKLPLKIADENPVTQAPSLSAIGAAASNEQDVRSLEGLQVLVVDDNGINREVAERILSSEGAQVVTCNDGQQAVERLRIEPHRFDAVLMDVQMPIMDGCEATQAIRSELGLTRLPIVAVTAGALVEERERALAAGMTDFVTKPLSPSALVKIICTHVAQPDLARTKLAE
jgi:signal transduction histidine kinase/ActR/RegA family two-component response regulator